MPEVDSPSFDDRDTPERLEDGRLLFSKECEFLWEAKALDNLPPLGLPEVAFAGRSNVGKSSLVNALTGQKALARSSNTPGRTQSLVFFELGQRLRLVDLPGYGYAKVSRSKVADWTELTQDFLRGRSTLARLYLLVDARHGFKPSDHEMMDMLDESALSYQIILTKADKLKPNQQLTMLAATEAVAKKRRAAHPEVLLTSAGKNIGIAALRSRMAALAV